MPVGRQGRQDGEGGQRSASIFLQLHLAKHTVLSTGCEHTPPAFSHLHSLGTVRLKRSALSMIFSMLRIWSRV